MRFLLNVGLVLGLAGMLWAADAGKTYAIVLHRGSKIGDQYHISADAEDKTFEQNSVAGQVVNTKDGNLRDET